MRTASARPLAVSEALKFALARLSRSPGGSKDLDSLLQDQMFSELQRCRLRLAVDSVEPRRQAGLIIHALHDNGNRRSCFLGGAGSSGPPVTMTSTLRRTSSAASAGRRSSFPSADRHSMTMFFPSTYPSSRRPCRNASVRAGEVEREAAR